MTPRAYTLAGLVVASLGGLIAAIAPYPGFLMVLLGGALAAMANTDDGSNDGKR